MKICTCCTWRRYDKYNTKAILANDRTIQLFNQPNLQEDLFSFDSEDAESLLEVYLQVWKWNRTEAVFSSIGGVWYPNPRELDVESDPHHWEHCDAEIGLKAQLPLGSRSYIDANVNVNRHTNICGWSLWHELDLLTGEGRILVLYRCCPVYCVSHCCLLVYTSLFSSPWNSTELEILVEFRIVKRLMWYLSKPNEITAILVIEVYSEIDTMK